MARLSSTIYATTDTPLGNGAFTADGRLVVSHHPMYVTPNCVSVFAADGSLQPYPNAAWNTPGYDPLQYLDAVLGLHNDSMGRIWFADMGTRSGNQPKLVVWDTRADTLWKVIPLPAEVTTPFSEPNDFVVDEVRGKVYIADEGAGGGGDGSRAALIVVDIATGAAERRLDGFEGMRAEPFPLILDGHRIEHAAAPGQPRQPMAVGVDGICMDAAGEWLYLSPLNGHTLWRVRVTDLLDPELDDPALGTRLERYASKPNSGGMCMAPNGDIYLTVIERNAIGRVSAAGRRYDEPVVRRDMYWPDGIMMGPDGGIYVVTTQLPRSPALARQGEKPVLPFKVFRFDPIAADPVAEFTADMVQGAVAGVVAAGATTAFQALVAHLRPHAETSAVIEPPEVVASRIYEVAVGTTPPPKVATIGGALVHVATGAGLGILYTLLRKRTAAVTTGRGAVFGLGVWGVLGETVLAVTGIKPPPWRTPLPDHVLEGTSHLVFGMTLDAMLPRRLPISESETYRSLR